MISSLILLSMTDFIKTPLTKDDTFRRNIPQYVSHIKHWLQSNTRKWQNAFTSSRISTYFTSISREWWSFSLTRLRSQESHCRRRFRRLSTSFSFKIRSSFSWWWCEIVSWSMVWGFSQMVLRALTRWASRLFLASIRAGTTRRACDTGSSGWTNSCPFPCTCKRCMR